MARAKALITFREATIADCEALANVHIKSWRESFAGIVPQSFLDRMSVERRAKAFERGFALRCYRMYVAEAADRGLVGFADFGEPREKFGAYEGELYAIYLLPEFQRRGIGAKLFNLGVEFLVRNGRNSMYLLALEVSPFRSFYEKLGGRVVARKQIEIEGRTFDELVYGWDELNEIRQDLQD